MAATYRETRFRAQGNVTILIVHDVLGVQIGIKVGNEDPRWALLIERQCEEIAEEITLMENL